MRSCCVPSCPEYDDTCTSFFRFPRDPVLRAAWITAVGFSADFQPNNDHFVCINHFDAAAIAQRADRKIGIKALLRKNSIPKIFHHNAPTTAVVLPKQEAAATTAAATTAEGTFQIVQQTQSMVADGEGEDANKEEDAVMQNPLYLCELCHRIFKLGKLLLDHVRDDHRAELRALKFSSLISQMRAEETVYSSDSECEYTVTVMVTKTPKRKNGQVAEDEPAAKKAKSEEEEQRDDATTTENETQVNETTFAPMEENSSTFVNHQEINYEIQLPQATDEVATELQPVTNGTVEEETSQQEQTTVIEQPPEAPFEETTVVESKQEGSDLQLDSSGGLLNDSSERKTLYECKLCMDLVLSETKLLSHISSAHGMTIQPNEIPIYSKRYPYRKVPHPEGGPTAWGCALCQMLFYNVHNLRKHQKTVHGKMLSLMDEKASGREGIIHNCYICSKTFLNPENLRLHLNDHIDTMMPGSEEEAAAASIIADLNKLYKCSHCGAEFDHEVSLTKHTIENHATLQLYSCDKCMEVFGTEAELAQHSETNHQDVPLNLICPEENCSAQFVTRNAYYEHILYAHQKVYKDDARFIEFLRHAKPKMSVPAFEETDTWPDDNGKYVCKHCDRQFTLQVHLKLHLYRPAGQDALECPECHKLIANKTCMAQHMTIRHGKLMKKALKCQKCPMMFRMRRDYLEHLKSHKVSTIEVKRYKCEREECDKVFVNYTDYHQHMVLMHGGIGPEKESKRPELKLFKCRYKDCNMRFGNEQFLRQHIKDAHMTRLKAGPANTNVASQQGNQVTIEAEVEPSAQDLANALTEGEFGDAVDSDTSTEPADENGEGDDDDADSMSSYDEDALIEVPEGPPSAGQQQQPAASGSGAPSSALLFDDQVCNEVTVGGFEEASGADMPLLDVGTKHEL